jgi:hypothetical protein
VGWKTAKKSGNRREDFKGIEAAPRRLIDAASDISDRISRIEA